MIETVLIIGSVLLIAYGYVMYPVLMRFSARFFGKPWLRDSSKAPSISIILAVYNEEMVIRQCLNSLLNLDYPLDSVEILIGSDGSTDGTEVILKEFANDFPHIHLYLFQERRGKIPVVNDLVSRSIGEVLFFTDADVTIDMSSLRMHARNYVSEEVGGVAGNLILSGTEGQKFDPLKSEQYYMSVENRLRQNEAMLHSTVGIFGGHYSIRSALWHELPNEPICDELFIGLNVIKSGRRMIFERDAIAREHFVRTMSDEFKRKTRFAARGLATLVYFKPLMVPWAGWPAIMLWSHKLARWLSSLCILLLIAITFIASIQNPHGWMLGVFALELGATIVLASSAFIRRINKRFDFLSYARWFFAMNAAFALGTLRFFTKSEKRFWTPSTRVRLQSATSPIDVVSAKETISKEAVHS